MKSILFFILAGSILSAHADTISAVISKKPIRLYATAEDLTPVQEITPEELTKTLPLPVISEQDERIKLSIEQKSFWASSIAFKINRDCKVVTRITTMNTKDTAAIRGVGNEGGCTK